MSTQEQNTPLPHDLQIQLDVDLYGIAYERLLPDGTIERIDPTTIRVTKIKEKPCMFPDPIKINLDGDNGPHYPAFWESKHP